MKLFTSSWLLGMSSYVLLGVLRRSGFPVTGWFLGTPGDVVSILLFVSTVIGSVLGVLSWRRREVKTWWTVGVTALNLVVLAGTLLLFAG